MAVLSSSILIERFKQDGIKRIIERCLNHDILTEDDLQFVTYSSMLDITTMPMYNNTWRVFNRLYDRNKEMYPDLSLFNGNKRKIIVELKHEVDRNVSTESIEDDVIKISGFLREYEEIERGLVIATIWDDIETKKEKLEGFSMSAKEEFGERFDIFIIDIHREVEPHKATTWINKHHELHQRYRI